VARNTISVAVGPDRVWAVLADARSYGHWVVGSSEIRDADVAFPAPGSRFHHRVGWGPFKVADHTEVLAAEAGRHLRLKAKARPLGTAIVDVTLRPDGHGCEVTMVEDAGDRASRLAFNPLGQLLVRVRNAASLRRLKAMAEGRGPHPEEAARP
jgi:uncharacterized protein YndB with AHSA1/START domain